MTKRMLIDATHAEETRVVVMDGNRLEDFDVETSTKRQLKGNIYLAKVVRVEPSLQAAFVEYGGNRHGFLAFGEIHPDYYQIPVADRQRLIEQEAEEARREEEEEDRAAEAAARDGAGETAEPGLAAMEPPSPTAEAADDESDATPTAQPAAIISEAGYGAAHAAGEEVQSVGPVAPIEPAEPAVEVLETEPPTLPDAAIDAVEDSENVVMQGRSNSIATEADESPAVADDGQEVVFLQDVIPEPLPPERVGGDTVEETRERRMPPRFLRNYKIQEVIKRRPILLVQVVKEERGTKGAALTTYLSLA